MPPAPATPTEILRRLVLRLILMLGCARIFGTRAMGLQARLARMGEGHRHRARLEKECARAERYRRMLADPEFWADAGTAGKAAEVARVAADAGRLALVRRMIWPGRVRRLSGAAPEMGAVGHAPPDRCMPGIVVPDLRRTGSRPAASLHASRPAAPGRPMDSLAPRGLEGPPHFEPDEPNMPRRLAFAFSLLLALAAPWPALAHAILLESQPAQGAAVAPGEATLRLRFNSRIDAARSRLALVLAGGKDQVLAIARGERDDLLIAPAALVPGPQVLRWQVLAVDGHITRGELRFTVRQAAP